MSGAELGCALSYAGLELYVTGCYTYDAEDSCFELKEVVIDSYLDEPDYNLTALLESTDHWQAIESAAREILDQQHPTSKQPHPGWKEGE